MPRLELEITEALDGRTVRSLLRGELGLSAGCVGRLKRAEGGITVGGVRVFSNAVLQTGDTLTVDLDAAERPTAVEPVPMELDITFEDEHLLILNKSAPLAVIPSSQAWCLAWATSCALIPVCGSRTTVPPAIIIYMPKLLTLLMTRPRL